jgi:hypothetical protein
LYRKKITEAYPLILEMPKVLKNPKDKPQIQRQVHPQKPKVFNVIIKQNQQKNLSIDQHLPYFTLHTIK